MPLSRTGKAAPVSQPAHKELSEHGRGQGLQHHLQGLHILLHHPAEHLYQHLGGERLSGQEREREEGAPTQDHRAPGATLGNPGPPRGQCLGCAWGRGRKGDPRDKGSSLPAGHRQDASQGAHPDHHLGRQARGEGGGEGVDHDRQDFYILKEKTFIQS